MIKAIIFDLGGVCFSMNWEEISRSMQDKFNINTLLKSSGNEKAIQLYIEALEGKKDIKDMFEELNTEGHDIDEILGFYKELYAKNKNFNQEMLDLINKLKEDFTLICLTDTNRIHLETHKEQGLLENFQKAFASFQLGSRKADKNTFIKILNQLDLSPEEVLFVDDNEKNIENAKSLGINAIRYENYADFANELDSFLILK